MEEIRTFIEQIYPINNFDWNYFSKKLEKIELKKKITPVKCWLY